MMPRFKQVNNLIDSQLEGLLLRTTLDSLLRQLALPVLQIDDSLLDCICNSKFIDYHVDCLRESVHTIDRLFLDKLRPLVYKTNI